MPWSTPGVPSASVAEWRFVCTPSPPASTPTSLPAGRAEVAPRSRRGRAGIAPRSRRDRAPDVLIRDEGVEHPDGVRSAADASDDNIRQPADLLEHLRARLVADHRLEVADDRRERVRADGRADEVVGRRDVRHLRRHVSDSQAARASAVGWHGPLTQSRIASLIASFSVAEPDETGTTVAPSIFIRNTLSDWRLQSSEPMYTTHSRPRRAHTVAVATPCWPAPVSAMIRFLPSRSARSPWPTALLILCAPVKASSSRLSQI